MSKIKKAKKSFFNEAGPKMSGTARIALKKEILPRTKGQASLVKSLELATISVVKGSAGSGKTYLAAFHAAKKLAEGEIDYLLISRPMVGIGGKDIGHLPGSEVEKVLPYLAPIIMSLKEFLGTEIVTKLIKEEKIKIVPISLLRGYSFKKSMTIIDEAQNLTPLEVKTILTRVGEESSLALLGDTDQVDLKGGYASSGIYDLEKRLEASAGSAKRFIDIVTLTSKDIQRSEAVAAIVELYKRTEEE